MIIDKLWEGRAHDYTNDAFVGIHQNKPVITGCLVLCISAEGLKVPMIEKAAAA